MRIAQFRPIDVANGYGIRSSLFVSGCHHACPGCFNLEYQDFSYGQAWSQDLEEEILEKLRQPQIQGLTLLGGEPMEFGQELAEILIRLRSQLAVEGLDKDVWVYSGYTFEEICADAKKKLLLDQCDVLVDGLFVESLKDPALSFRGSSNQRVIDLKKTRLAGQIELLDVDK